MSVFDRSMRVRASVPVLAAIASAVLLCEAARMPATAIASEQAASRPEITLAENGRSEYRIVIAQEPPPSTRYAAEELQHFLEQMSGARLPIVADTEAAAAHEILVGRSRRLETLGTPVDLAGLGREGYVLCTVGSRLVIAGGEPRGTLYGVYGLLEDHCGCRWFTPEIERIPRHARLALAPLAERKVPVFEYRETYLWESYDGNWMARNRLNGAGGRGRLFERQKIQPPVPALEARHGGDIRCGQGFFVHTLGSLVPAQKHFAAHPQYYALWKGQRDPDQLCCTNPDVIRLCTEAIRAGMRAQPEATVFSLSQNDNRKYCQCDACQALAQGEGTQMAQVLHLVNAVAQGVEAEFPGKVVETLAYQWSRQAPRAMRPRSNVVIRLCNIECCFAHPLAGACSTRNSAFVADLQRWAKVCDRLWIWDYVTDFHHYLLPFPNKRVLDDNLRLFAANHVTGVFEEGTYDTPDGELAALGAYLLAKFLWDPQYDENRAMNEFLAAYYGPADGPIRRYIDLLHDYVAGKDVHVGIGAAPTSGHLPPELLIQANALWDEAEARARDDRPVLDRVRRSRMSVDYAIVEQARAAAARAGETRTGQERALLALARNRFEPFVQTLEQSPLKRIREWRDLNKAEYRRGLAEDLDLRARLPAEVIEEAHRKAQQFIDNERQFHLGFLPTEQSHRKTAGLTEKASRDLPAAIRMLQAVDAELPSKAAQVAASPEFQRLVGAMRQALDGQRRICFSGCGATGRLSILLEACWRQFWQELRARHPAAAARLPDMEDRVASIMTGGDYALIRSVENFEDHAVFGRRQVQEARLGKGDVLVAISEGGETSSVIGSISQALDDGATAFFVFNNPADVLASHIERSRQVIEDRRVTKLDLACGPMAVAGSTRMQATTSELLVVGAAMELALVETLRARLNAAEFAGLGVAVRAPADYPALFAQLLGELGRPEAVAALAAMVQYEEHIYGRKGLVTYMADACLLDIFTDTTERSPTFMLPRFRKSDDRVSPASWAFVKNPLLATPEAWRWVLRREPRCLAWDAELYRQLGAPAQIQEHPPALSVGEMLKFTIGNENDPSRYAVAENAAILIAVGEEAARLAAPESPLRAGFEACAGPFGQRALLSIGPTAPPRELVPTAWHVPVRLPASPLRLWERMADKLVLNTVSTATMARMGRLVSNWMAYVETTNKKLIDRGTRLVAELSGVDYQTACYALHETIAELARTVPPGQEKPSAVALTIARLKRK